MQYLVENKKVRVNAFVIMDNHVHFIWQALYGFTLNEIQTSFKKHTSMQFLKLLQNDKDIEMYQVSSLDRNHNFWKRNSLSIELFTKAVFLQKLYYIHNNPVAAGICKNPEDFKYSSAQFYIKGINHFNFIEHYLG